MHFFRRDPEVDRGGGAASLADTAARIRGEESAVRCYSKFFAVF